MFRHEKGDKLNWLICIDGTDQSFKGFEEATKVLNKETDLINLITINSGEINLPKIKSQCLQLLAQSGCKGEFIGIENAEQLPPAEVILDYLNKEDTPDYQYVVVASKGERYYQEHTEEYLGSQAELIIKNAKSNIFLVV